MGAAGPSAVAQWERGTNVPEGVRRERLVALLEGRLWPALRAAAIVSDGLPRSWERGARWFRRASREQPTRETVGVVEAAILAELRAITPPQGLRGRYCEHDGDWVRTVDDRCGLGEQHRSDLRRLEDAAYGMRWLELAHDLRLDLRHSLASQVPSRPIGIAPGATAAPEPAPDE